MRSSRALAPQAAANATALLVSLGANLVIVALAFRHLGAHVYGEYVVISTCLLLTPLLEGAADLVLGRWAASSGGEGVSGSVADVRRALTSASVATLVAVAGADVVLSLGTHGTDRSRLPWLVALLGVASAAQLGTAGVTGTATGLERFAELSVASVAGSVISVVIAATTLSRLGVVALGLAQLAGIATNRVVLALTVAELRGTWWAGRRGGSARRGWRLMGPTVAATITSQLLTLIDVVVIQILRGPGPVGVYRIGSQVPTVLVGLLTRLVDVSFPRLTASEEGRDLHDRLAGLMKVSSAVAGVSFGVLIAERSASLDVFGGAKAVGAATVLVTTAVTWMINTPVHVVALSLFARGKQDVLVPVLAVESAVNIVLTVVLVAAWGIDGAAIATLISVALSNTLVLPLLTRSLPSLPLQRLTWQCYGVEAAAVGAALAVGAITDTMPISSLARIAVDGAVTTIVCAPLAIVWLGPDARQMLRRAVRPIDHAGASAPH